jgi:hypothetical protein
VRDFELDRPVDAVAIEANNSAKQVPVEPLAVKVPFVVVPLIAWHTAAVVYNLGLWIVVKKDLGYFKMVKN